MPDPYRETLSRREEFFRRLGREPVRSRRVFDRATFLRNAARTRPERSPWRRSSRGRYGF